MIVVGLRIFSLLLRHLRGFGRGGRVRGGLGRASKIVFPSPRSCLRRRLEDIMINISFVYNIVLPYFCSVRLFIISEIINGCSPVVIVFLS